MITKEKIIIIVFEQRNDEFERVELTLNENFSRRKTKTILFSNISSYLTGEREYCYGPIFRTIRKKRMCIGACIAAVMR